MFHLCVTVEALPLLLQNSIGATIWSEILQYGLTYTMQTMSHIYDAIRCEPSDVSGYLIRTSGCLIWHDLTTLKRRKSSINTVSHDAPTVSARFVYGFTTTHAGSATVHSDGATNAQECPRCGHDSIRCYYGSSR